MVNKCYKVVGYSNTVKKTNKTKTKHTHNTTQTYMFLTRTTQTEKVKIITQVIYSVGCLTLSNT